MAHSQYSITQQFRTFLRWFTTPFIIPERPEDRRRAQALLIILLVAFLLAISTYLIRPYSPMPTLPFDVGLALLFILYVISRWRFYRIGIYTTLVISALLNPLIFLLVPGQGDLLLAVAAAIISMLLADLLGAAHITFVAVIVNILCVGTIVAFSPDIPVSERLQWVLPVIFVGPFIIIKAYVTQYDIQQLRQQTRQLGEDERRSRLISELMTDYAYAFDVQPNNRLRLRWMTGAYVQVTGRTYQELAAMPDWEALIHPESHQQYRMRLEAVLHGDEHSTEFQIVRPDGSVAWVYDSARPVVDSSGRVVSIYGAGHDVTERVLAEKSHAILNARRADELERIVQERTADLKRQHEQLQAILDATGEGIMYTEDGLIFYANHALAEMTGRQPHEFFGADPEMLLAADLSDEERATLQAVIPAMLRGDIWRYEVRVARKDGTTFAAAQTSSLVGSPGEGVRRAVTVVRDISREKELDEMKNRFIANAAHELRTPIANLNTTLYLIQKQPDKMAEYLMRLEQVISRINHLIADLLDVSYFEHGRITLRREALILQDVVKHVIELQQPEAANKSITLSSELSDEPVQVWADTYRLEQVFTNLIANAINYTAVGGFIRLYDQCQALAKRVTVAVEDTGKGIAQEDVTRIFQPFYRVAGEKHAEGTGLGLTITHEIVALHGGHIYVESTPGVGSTFYVTLPLLED